MPPGQEGANSTCLTQTPPGWGHSRGFSPVPGLRWVPPAPPASVLPHPWRCWVPGPLLNAWVFSPFLYFAVTSQVSSQEEQPAQVAGGLPARKQALPPSPVFKKLLPRFPVLGLSVPFPLRGRGWRSNIPEWLSGQLPGPTRHHCKETRDRPCPYERATSLRPAGVWHILGMSLGMSLGLVFVGSGEAGAGHCQIGALCRNPTIGSSWSTCRQLLPASGPDPQAPIPAPHHPGHLLGAPWEGSSAASARHPAPACTDTLPRWLGTKVFPALWTELGSFPAPLGCAGILPHPLGMS